MRTTFRKQAVVISMMLIIVGTSVAVAMGGDMINVPRSLHNVEPIRIQCATNEDTIEITYHITHFTQVPVDIDGGQYVRIELGDESNMLLKGMPDLPDIRRSILIPDSAKMSIAISHSNYKIYKNMYLAPSKGNIPRTLNPDTIP